MHILRFVEMWFSMILSVLRWPKFVRSFCRLLLHAGFPWHGFSMLQWSCGKGWSQENATLLFFCLIPHLSGEVWLLDLMRVHLLLFLLLFLLLVLAPRQLRSSTPSVLCRTSTAIIRRDGRKNFRRYVRKNVRKNDGRYVRKNARRYVGKNVGCSTSCSGKH